MAHIRQILANLSISVSEFKKNPKTVIKAVKNEPIAVIIDDKPDFYCVPADILESLYQKFYEMNDMTLQTMQELNDASANEPDPDACFGVNDIFQSIEDEQVPLASAADIVDPINTNVADPLDEEVVHQINQSIDNHVFENSPLYAPEAFKSDNEINGLTGDSFDDLEDLSEPNCPCKHSALDAKDKPLTTAQRMAKANAFSEASKAALSALENATSSKLAKSTNSLLIPQLSQLEHAAVALKESKAKLDSLQNTRANNATPIMLKVSESKLEFTSPKEETKVATHNVSAAKTSASANVANIEAASANDHGDTSDKVMRLGNKIFPTKTSVLDDGDITPELNAIASLSDEINDVESLSSSEESNEFASDPIGKASVQSKRIEDNAALKEAIRDAKLELKDNQRLSKLVSGPHSYTLEHVARTYSPYPEDKKTKDSGKDKDKEKDSKESKKAKANSKEHKDKSKKEKDKSHGSKSTLSLKAQVKRQLQLQKERLKAQVDPHGSANKTKINSETI